MDGWEKHAQKLRVPVGTALGILFLILMRPDGFSLLAGAAVAALGAGLRLWAAGHIDKGKNLTLGGPYARTRNPLYLGSFLMALGVLVAGRVFWLLVPFGIFFALFYVPVMRAEEKELAGGYGARFEEYRQKVPLFFPRLRVLESTSSFFQWSRVVRNREHRTLIGLALAETFLILKTLA